MKAQRTILQLTALDETGDSNYRMRWPAAQLSQFEPSWRVINLDAGAKERFEWAERADLLVLYQSADLELMPVLKSRRARGKRTLAEYNDNFYAPQAWSPVVQEWSSPLLWQHYECLMQAADGVLVTGKGLETLFAGTVDRSKIHIIENCFPFDVEPFASLYPPSKDGIVLAWGGSLGHMADILAVAPLLREILAETPGVRLQIMGNQAIPELLRMPPDRFEFTPWGPVQEYLRFLRKAHIGIVPLLDTEYNRCRSDIKAVEISALGGLPLLPALPPYEEFLRATGLKPYQSFSELKEQIAAYIMRPERIREDAERCYHYVKNARLGSVDRKRLQVYAQHISGKSDPDSWPVGAGYHEVRGTRQEKSAIQECLAVADSFVKLRQLDDASRALERFLAQNPHVPEVALADLRVRRSLGQPATGAKIEQAAKSFPRDLRFRLLQAQWAQSSEELSTAWNAIIAALRPAKQAAQDFFRPHVMKLFMSMAQASPQLLLPIGEALLGIYTNAAELRFYLAQSYEHAGNFQLAQSHFNWLRDSKRLSDPNHSILTELDNGYLEAWCQALEARLQGQ